MAKNKINIQSIQNGNIKLLAKAITIVENDLEGSEELLLETQANPQTKVVGITGPPGAGKSTLINALLHQIVSTNQKVAVLSVDPSSPFNFGSLLGDRIRMNDFYLNPNVFIRSIASRGSLGGLSAKIIEIVDLVKSAAFDYILIETVGVGQSEVEIAGLADTTIVVLVPEAGDEIQTMKAGLMEIADIFIVNKSDRPHADDFAKNLVLLSHQNSKKWQIPVIKCIASEGYGIQDVLNNIVTHSKHNTEQNIHLLTEKAYNLLINKRMKDIHKEQLKQKIANAIEQESFNLYQFVNTL